MTTTMLTPPASGYGFAAVARMEWLKLCSVRSAWWLLTAGVLAMVAAGVGVGLGYRGYAPVATPAQIVDNALGGSVLAQLLLGALGVLVVTSEYSSGLIRTTFAAIPRRPLVLAAKACVFGGASLAVGIVASLAGFAASQLAVAGSPVPAASLGGPGILRAVLLTGVYLGFSGLLGVGLGAILRNTGGAIGTLFAGLFVPMLLAGMIGPSGFAVSRFLPVIMLLNSISVTAPVPGMLSAWLATVVMAAYAAAAVAIGAVLVARRDV